MTLTQVTKAGLHTIALDHVFTIGASGSDHYTFQGEGLNGTVNDPTLYLTRGKTYRFENGSGGHPIRIQSTSGASGTAYNTGVTNNAGSGTVIVEVQHDAPDVLYYQCTSHAAMNGILYITGALADGGVTTAKLADDAVTDTKLANSINTAIAANTAKNTNATHTGDVTGSGSLTIASGAVTTAKIADQAVTLAKLPHGDGSSDGKFLRANNGADPSFETVSIPAGTTINNNANNRFITGSASANTLEGESDVTFDKVNGVDPTLTVKRSSTAGTNHDTYGRLQLQNTSGTNMGEIHVRRESGTDDSYMDFKTKAAGQTAQGSFRLAGSTGTAYFVGSLGRANNNQPAYMSNTVYGGSTVPSSMTIKTLSNGGETGLLIIGTSQGGGSTDIHSCLRIDAINCANNAQQYGMYTVARQQNDKDTGGIYTDVYGSYGTTYVYRAHLQKQVGAYTNGYSFFSKITQTSSGGASYHFRGDQDGTQRIRIELDGDIDNSNNSYGSLSDVKLKENIVDANSQWEDIKAIKVRNYNFKSSTGLSAHKQIGVVAQELETVSAGLVKTENDIEVDEATGKGTVTGTTKSVKYSILYMKAIKALQEAMAKIETLETKVAALEAG